MKKKIIAIGFLLGVATVGAVDYEVVRRPKKVRPKSKPRGRGKNIAPLINRFKRPKNCRVSIIIPCKYTHAQFLYTSLKAYEQQTVIPHEVVISLSEAHLADEAIIAQLQNEPWQFSLQLIMSDHVIWAGENRNIACRHAHGDIFLCHDADDLPHPQRVEIIKYLFDRYNVDHLMHNFMYSHEFHSFAPYNVSRITFKAPRNYVDANRDPRNHNGNIAISRNLFNKIQWPNDMKGQDVHFNRMVYKKFRRRMRISLPLILYKIEQSSWGELFKRIYQWCDF